MIGLINIWFISKPNNKTLEIYRKQVEITYLYTNDSVFCQVMQILVSGRGEIILHILFLREKGGGGDWQL